MLWSLKHHPSLVFNGCALLCAHWPYWLQGHIRCGHSGVAEWASVCGSGVPPPPQNIKSNVVEKPVARELVPCLHA